MPTPNDERRSMSEAKLLPCPFCGAKSVIEHGAPYFRAKCEETKSCAGGAKCGSGPWKISEIEAIAAWNRRDARRPDSSQALEVAEEVIVNAAEDLEAGHEASALARLHTAIAFRSPSRVDEAREKVIESGLDLSRKQLALDLCLDNQTPNGDLKSEDVKMALVKHLGLLDALRAALAARGEGK